jgi:hypothetical protein
MSQDFEEFVQNAEYEDRLRAQQAERAEQEDYDAIDIFDPAMADSEMAFDLRSEIYAQIKLIKAIRSHLFHKNGQPKVDTDPSDITAFMNSSMKLLSMLQSFESSLKTDAEVRRVELAIEMAMEDCSCPEFISALVGYLEGDLI